LESYFNKRVDPAWTWNSEVEYLGDEQTPQHLDFMSDNPRLRIVDPFDPNDAIFDVNNLRGDRRLWAWLSRTITWIARHSKNTRRCTVKGMVPPGCKWDDRPTLRISVARDSGGWLSIQDLCHCLGVTPEDIFAAVAWYAGDRLEIAASFPNRSVPNGFVEGRDLMAGPLDREAYQQWCAQETLGYGSGNLPGTAWQHASAEVLGAGKGKRASAEVLGAGKGDLMQHEIARTMYTPQMYNVAGGAQYLCVRAVQGHSNPMIDYRRMYVRVSLDMLKHIPTIVHGTPLRNVRNILACGIKRMGRNMVHCSAFPFGHEKARPDALTKYGAAVEFCKEEILLRADRKSVV
jgi:hypothetical protein